MSPRRIKPAVSLLLMAAVFCVYWQTGDHGPVNCDDYYITGLDLFETDIFSWDNFIFALTYTVCGVWMPLTYLVVGIERLLFGTDYGAWHLFAAFLHGLNAVLLFLILCRITGALWKSALVAAIFALHPLNVEAVAWLAAIRVVASAFFALLAFYIYAGYVRTGKVASYLLVGILYFSSVFCFPMFITLPFVFLLLDFWPLGRFRMAFSDSGRQTGSAGQSVSSLVGIAGRLVWEKYFFFLIMLGAGLTVVGSHELPAMYQYDLPSRLLNAVLSYGKYLWKLLVPLDLAVFYPYPAEFVTWKIGGLLLLLTGITAWGLLCVKRFPYVLVGWLWFAGMIFPFTGIAQIGTQAMADHYAYLAMVGFWMAVVWSGADFLRVLFRRPLLPALLSVVIVALLGVLSWRQAGYWRNSETLARHMLQVTNNNYEGYNYLGQARAASGEVAAAVAAFRRGLAIKPDHLNMNFNLALALTQQGRKNAAIKYYRKALAVDPRHVKAHNNIGTLFDILDDTVRAEYHYRRAIAIQPDYWRAKNNLADLLMSTGRVGEALSHYATVLPHADNPVEIHYRLALGYVRIGQDEKAVTHLTRALEMAPEETRLRQMMNRITTGKGAERAD